MPPDPAAVHHDWAPHLDALTADQRTPTPPPVPAHRGRGEPKPTNRVDHLYDLEGQHLNVEYVQDAAMVTLRFGTSTANLNLVEAKHLAVALGDRLDAWRNTIDASR